MRCDDVRPEDAQSAVTNFGGIELKCMLDRRTPTELLRIASEHRTEYAQQYVHVESLSSVVLCSFKL